jgi:demethylmenaquinone methyltransferase/2-methoxy-6-polyprenyl-1,4-benzoquinol methylase
LTMPAGSPEGKPLHRIFAAVPPRYDLVNHVITLGMDNRWRLLAAGECLAAEPKSMLDLCCGTADLLLLVAQKAGPDTVLAGIDYSQPMLELAERKLARLNSKVSFIYGDAVRLPFPDGSFDCVGISFAFRNLTYRNPLRERSLREVARVLREGGRFVIVESSQPSCRLIRGFAHLYLRCFVYPAGYILSGNRGAYRYLSESARRFYSPDEIKQMLLGAGFREVSYRPLFFGAAGIHIAVK